MTLAQAERALGIALVVFDASGALIDGKGGKPRCYHAHPADTPARFSLMFRDGRLARVSLDEPESNIRTDRGIALGDTADKARGVYGRQLIDEVHEYQGPVGRYLTWWRADKKRGIRFETGSDGLVQRIHAGGVSITLIEGCS